MRRLSDFQRIGAGFLPGLLGGTIECWDATVIAARR